MATSPAWVRELRSKVGTVTSPSVRYRDFGGPAPEAPLALVRTETREQLVHVLSVAASENLPVAVRGAGHSSGGQTFAPSGIVIQHTPGGGLQLEGEAIEVPGHWSWEQVEGELRKVGRDLTVATSSLETTVAGTLSMGGFGVRSIARGAQVDHVTELHLVCASGEELRCSPKAHSEVFRCALTGAGQVGIIDRARMATSPRRPFLSCSMAQHDSFADLASAILWMRDLQTEVPDQFSALLKDGMLQSIAATLHTSYEAALRVRGRHWQRCGTNLTCRTMRSEEFEADERRMPRDLWWRSRNLWSDYCFDADAFVPFCEFVDREVRGTLATHLAYMMVIAPPQNSFSLDMRSRAQERLFSLGLFYGVAEQDAASTQLARAAHSKALGKCLDLGGRPYLYGCWGGRNGLSAETLGATYGASYELLRSIRAQLDPRGLLNPHALNYP